MNYILINILVIRFFLYRKEFFFSYFPADSPVLLKIYNKLITLVHIALLTINQEYFIHFYSSNNKLKVKRSCSKSGDSKRIGTITLFATK